MTNQPGKLASVKSDAVEAELGENGEDKAFQRREDVGFLGQYEIEDNGISERQASTMPLAVKSTFGIAGKKMATKRRNRKSGADPRTNQDSGMQALIHHASRCQVFPALGMAPPLRTGALAIANLKNPRI